jgi:hypothetical protein
LSLIKVLNSIIKVIIEKSFKKKIKTRRRKEYFELMCFFLFCFEIKLKLKNAKIYLKKNGYMINNFFHKKETYLFVKNQ